MLCIFKTLCVNFKTGGSNNSSKLWEGLLRRASSLGCILDALGTWLLQIWHGTFFGTAAESCQAPLPAARVLALPFHYRLSITVVLFSKPYPVAFCLTLLFWACFFILPLLPLSNIFSLVNVTFLHFWTMKICLSCLSCLLFILLGLSSKVFSVSHCFSHSLNKFALLQTFPQNTSVFSLLRSRRELFICGHWISDSFSFIFKLLSYAISRCLDYYKHSNPKTWTCSFPKSCHCLPPTFCFCWTFSQISGRLFNYAANSTISHFLNAGGVLRSATSNTAYMKSRIFGFSPDLYVMNILILFTKLTAETTC